MLPEIHRSTRGSSFRDHMHLQHTAWPADELRNITETDDLAASATAAPRARSLRYSVSRSALVQPRRIDWCADFLRRSPGERISPARGPFVVRTPCSNCCRIRDAWQYVPVLDNLALVIEPKDVNSRPRRATAGSTVLRTISDEPQLYA